MDATKLQTSETVQLKIVGSVTALLDLTSILAFLAEFIGGDKSKTCSVGGAAGLLTGVGGVKLEELVTAGGAGGKKLEFRAKFIRAWVC